MSINSYKTYTVSCDHPGCIEYFAGYPGDGLIETRTNARLDGWTTGTGLTGDRCPQHKHTDDSSVEGVAT